MVKHIASILSQGRLEIDCNNCVVNIIPEGLNSVSRSLPYSEIDSDGWGYIYEKYVGQKYEEEEYQVEYLGLKNGFLDGGIIKKQFSRHGQIGIKGNTYAIIIKLLLSN